MYIYNYITFSNFGQTCEYIICLKHKNKDGRQQINYDSFIHFTLTILIHMKLPVGNNFLV